MVDKNLFPYDLAVVAILKDEAPYLAEWLDYHLAAGVEHFYLYKPQSRVRMLRRALSIIFTRPAK